MQTKTALRRLQQLPSQPADKAHGVDLGGDEDQNVEEGNDGPDDALRAWLLQYIPAACV